MVGSTQMGHKHPNSNIKTANHRKDDTSEDPHDPANAADMIANDPVKVAEMRNNADIMVKEMMRNGPAIGNELKQLSIAADKMPSTPSIAADKLQKEVGGSGLARGAFEDPSGVAADIIANDPVKVAEMRKNADRMVSEMIHNDPAAKIVDNNELKEQPIEADKLPEEVEGGGLARRAFVDPPGIAADMARSGIPNAGEKN